MPRHDQLGAVINLLQTGVDVNAPTQIKPEEALVLVQALEHYGRVAARTYDLLNRTQLTIPTMDAQIAMDILLSWLEVDSRERYQERAPNTVSLGKFWGRPT